jgi:hypothetical protein
MPNQNVIVANNLFRANWDDVFVDREAPFVVGAGVNLFGIENMPAAPVLFVPDSPRAGRPKPLDNIPPVGLQNLIQIQSNANLGI